MGKAETSMMKDTEKEGEERGNWVGNPAHGEGRVRGTEITSFRTILVTFSSPVWAMLWDWEMFGGNPSPTLLTL